MEEKEKRLKQLLIKLNWIEDKESDNPLVSISFIYLIDLLEDYKADRIQIYNFMWHLYLMIVSTIAYLAWKIYVYSTSVTFIYTKPAKNTWHKFKRKYRDFKRILTGYWEWHGLCHLKVPVIAWLIYGGIFIW